jgi:phosphinothricin acetyltransferase
VTGPRGAAASLPIRDPVIRPSRPEDLAEIQAITAHHILTGTGSFEEVPPDIDALALARERILAEGLPHLVALAGDRVAGFAQATPFRPRPAYRFTAEDSVYVHPGLTGQGIGRALLLAIVEQARAAGRRQLIAVIGDSANTPSLALHAALGFDRIGVCPSVGFKFGRWLDVVLMQRAL